MPSLYFSVGSSSPVNSELWKYDGVSASLVHTFVGTHGQFISCLAPCAATSKIYVNVIDFDAAGFVNGASTIWTLDPNTDILTKIVSYNFVDTQPPSFYGGGQLVPALKYMEDSGNIYFAHQCFNGDGRDHHIVKFNPSGGTVTLVAGPLSDTTSQPEGRGFLAKVGATYYWGQNGVIYSTATPDVPVSWTLYRDIASSSPFAQIITGGDFDPATGNYLFAAQDGLGQSSVMVYSIDNSGTLTTIYTDAGTTKRKHIYPAALVSSGVYSVVINDGAAGNIFSTPNEAGELYENSGGGWSYIGQIPDIIWNSDAIGRVGYVPPFNGGQGLAARSGIIYAISYYNSTVLTPTGTGVYLFSYDPVGATWAVVQRWAGNDTIHLSGSHRLCVMALAPAPPPPPSAGTVYFTIGQNPDYNPSEIWKYDGTNPPTHVADTNTNCNGNANDPLLMGAFAKNGKIYVITVDYELSSFGYKECDGVTPVPGSGTYHFGANSIYELDPATDILTHVLNYNYADGSPYDDVVPPAAIYDDGTYMYIAHQAWGSNDWHLVRFDPIAQTVAIVFGPYDASTYYQNTGFSLQNFTADGPGFVARVGSLLYYANGSEIFSSPTGDLGTWTLVSGAGIYGTTATWVARSPFDFDIGIISKGDYDVDGNYWFPATNDTSDFAGSPWHPYSLWNLSVFKIAAATGNITLEYQNLDDGSGGGGSTYGLYGYQASQLVNRNGVLTVFSDGSDTFYHPLTPLTPLASGGFVFDNSAGWAPIGQIPYSVYLAVGRQSSSGPTAGVMLGTDLLIISLFDDRVGSAGYGSHLIKQDAGGAWSIVQSWAGNQIFGNSRGEMLNIVVAPAAPPPPPPPTPVVSPVVPYCPTRAWVILYDTNGNRLAIFDDWKDLNITHKVNNVDTCVFSFDGADSRVDLFGVDYILEVWREVGAYQYIEYQGFVRVFQPQLTTDQHAIFTATTFGLMDLLRRRLVLYQSNTPFTFKSAPGETVMKQIVNENVGPLGNIPIRYLNGVTPGLTVQADAAQGKVWTDSIGNMNVLNILQGIAQLTNVDFDVVLTGKVPVAFEFRCYYPQRGANLSATVAFSPLLGNMVGPVYTHDYSQEVNSVVVLGPGQDGSRLMLTEVGPDVGASPWNIVEATITASGLPNISGLSDQFIYESMRSHADLMLTNNQPIQTFTFDVLQTDVLAYGRDYRLGDIVSARFGNVSLPLKVIEVGMQIKEGKEDIKITFSNLPARL